MSKYDKDGIKHWDTSLLESRKERLERLLKAYPYIGRGIRNSWNTELRQVERVLKNRNGGIQ